jgi:hypothetical protein
MDDWINGSLDACVKESILYFSGLTSVIQQSSHPLPVKWRHNVAKMIIKKRMASFQHHPRS